MLFTFEDVPADVPARDDGPYDYSQVAKNYLAAQHLVAFDILTRGFFCSVAAEGLRYDLIADVGGLRRIQVKMTSGLQMSGGYLRYRFWGGKMNQKLRDYRGDIDLFAFVAMDIKRILYVLPESVDVVAAAFKASYFEADRCELAWQAIVRGWAE